MNVVIMDVEMFDAPEEWPTIEQVGDVEMSEAPTKRTSHNKLDIASSNLNCK